MLFSLVETIASLHEDDFTHNDIKPENILLSRSNDGSKDLHLTLIDFECARHNTLPIDIQFDPPLGTAAYTAPEMILCVCNARYHRLVQRVEDVTKAVKEESDLSVPADSSLPYRRDLVELSTSEFSNASKAATLSLQVSDTQLQHVCCVLHSRRNVGVCVAGNSKA